ncbi:MAG: diaminopimelate decarboxylase [Rickettsiales bacterium]|jgi:diaminopimelate decarboxylase|nr:diaminopimelate decarboxylase [Rickettsiales bacterium]
MLSKIKYENNELYFDNVKVSNIAKEYGTPLYIYSKDRLIENYREYDDNFKKAFDDYQIHYAIKANDNLSILKLLAELGSGADTVSGNEVKKSIIAGFPANKIVFSGVSKSERELEYAIKQGVGQINIESYEEFLTIKRVVENIKIVANISVRVNPNIDAHTHEKITTGKKENKFGVPVEIAEKISAESKNEKFLNFKGISVHVGSQILEPSVFELVGEFLREIYAKHSEWTTLDLGGGLGIEYREEHKTPSKADYTNIVKKHLGDLKVKIMIEPGRSIVGDAGILLSKIEYTKQGEIKNFIMVDAGFNILIRPAMYDSYHHPLLVKNTSTEKKKYDIVGPICESGDIMVKDIEFPVPQGENYIVFLSAGAYGRSMSSNYNLHDLPREIWIDKGKIKEIRKAISFEDLIVFEKIN